MGAATAKGTGSGAGEKYEVQNGDGVKFAGNRQNFANFACVLTIVTHTHTQRVKPTAAGVQQLQIASLPLFPKEQPHKNWK